MCMTWKVLMGLLLLYTLGIIQMANSFMSEMVATIRAAMQV